MFQSLCRRRSCKLGFAAVLVIINILLSIQLIQNTQSPVCPDSSGVSKRHTIIDRRILPLSLIRIQNPEGIPDGAFNISLDHGHWDRQRLYKTFFFVLVGSNFTQLSQRYAVTLATQSSLDKLHSIVQVALQWTGPISAAVYAAGDDEYCLINLYIAFLRECFSSIRDRVSFHLTVPKDRMPTGQVPVRLKNIRKDQFDCRRPEAALKDLLRARGQATARWRLKSAYPQNHLRNSARKTAQTHFVFLTDIDIVPSAGLADKLDDFLKSPKRICANKCAYVIPTYELDDRAAFPWSKKDLIRLSRKGLARPFHQKVFIYNQFATNFTRWEKFIDNDDDHVVVSHNVTNFEFLYEPFYVAADTVPEHDERFIGYGYTRNTQVYEMYVAGFHFEVLSPIFTIHWGLQVKKGRPSWRERQNSLNRKHFDLFKREVFARYYKDPLRMLH